MSQTQINPEEDNRMIFLIFGAMGFFVLYLIIGISQPAINLMFQPEVPKVAQALTEKNLINYMQERNIVEIYRNDFGPRPMEMTTNLTTNIYLKTTSGETVTVPRVIRDGAMIGYGPDKQHFRIKLENKQLTYHGAQPQNKSKTEYLSEIMEDINFGLAGFDKQNTIKSSWN